MELDTSTLLDIYQDQLDDLVKEFRERTDFMIMFNTPEHRPAIYHLINSFADKFRDVIETKDDGPTDHTKFGMTNEEFFIHISNRLANGWSLDNTIRLKNEWYDRLKQMVDTIKRLYKNCKSLSV